MKSLLQNNKRNLLHIELLRIIAAYFVIFNHTSKKGFFLFSVYERGSLPYWVYMFFSVFCKISVPLFFMIAGALLLKKDMNLKEIWSKKISRILAALVIFTAVTYIGLGIWNGEETLSVVDYVQKLYTNQVTVVFWYLYAYMAFLIALPFLRAIVKTIKSVDYKYLFILFVLFTAVIPCIEYRFGQGNIRLYAELSPSWLFSNIVFWPLLGYYLENVWDIKKCSGRMLGVWTLLGMAGIGLSCYMTYYMHGVTGICDEDNSQIFHSTFIVLPCIAIYVAVKFFAERHVFSGVARKCITSLGSCTFGIYLLHVVVKKYLSGLWRVFRHDWQMNKMLAALLFCAVVFVICYGMTWVLKKVPGIKKVV